MTFLGFVITSVVLFFVFLAWYTFVHRNGESTPQGLEDTRVIGLQRRNQALMAETGEIGGSNERGPVNNYKQANQSQGRPMPESSEDQDGQRGFAPERQDFMNEIGELFNEEYGSQKEKVKGSYEPYKSKESKNQPNS